MPEREAALARFGRLYSGLQYRKCLHYHMRRMVCQRRRRCGSGSFSRPSSSPERAPSYPDVCHLILVGQCRWSAALLSGIEALPGSRQRRSWQLVQFQATFLAMSLGSLAL